MNVDRFQNVRCDGSRPVSCKYKPRPFPHSFRFTTLAQADLMHDDSNSLHSSPVDSRIPSCRSKTKTLLLLLSLQTLQIIPTPLAGGARLQNVSIFAHGIRKKYILRTLTAQVVHPVHPEPPH
jgi:hypothetical protein